jgi:hypothetical protein
MKYPLPIELPPEERPEITQEYGDKTRVAQYKAAGINISEHNGTDIVSSAGRQASFGARLVCPVPSAHLVKKWYTTPINTKGNGIEVGWYDEVGHYYTMKLWHCMEVADWKEAYVEGDTLGFMGNSGFVMPAPSAACPYCGSHLHLMVTRNGILIDPREIFDFTKWYIGPSTGGAKDKVALQWALSLLVELFKRLFGRAPKAAVQ